MFIGLLINFNSHFNDISQIFDPEFRISENFFTLLGIGWIDWINLIRSTSLFLISIFILIFYTKIIKLKNSPILNIYYLYLVIQFISFFLSRDLVNEFDNLYYWVNQFLLISILYYFFSLDKFLKINNYLFYILIVFIFIVSTVLIKNLLYEFFTTPVENFYFSSFTSPGSEMLNQGVPRITGIARMLVILIIFSLMIFVNSKYKIISFSILVILTALLLLTESRFAIYSLLFISISFMFLDKKFSFPKKIIYFIAIFSFAQLFYVFVYEIKDQIVTKKMINVETKKIIDDQLIVLNNKISFHEYQLVEEIKKLNIEYPNKEWQIYLKNLDSKKMLHSSTGEKDSNVETTEKDSNVETTEKDSNVETTEKNVLNKLIIKEKDTLKIKNILMNLDKVKSTKEILKTTMSSEESERWKKEKILLKKDRNKTRITENFTTSGRATIWKEALIIAKKKLLIGYGFQADRYHFNNTSSNAYIYSLISGGIFSLLLFIIICYISFFTCLRIIFINKIFEKKSNIIVKTCLLINILVLGRTIVENSFATYNFDLLIFFITYAIMNHYERDHKKLVN